MSNKVTFDDRPLRTVISTDNLSYMGIPKRFHNTTLDDFKTNGSKQLRAFKSCVEDYINNLVYHLKKDGMGLCMLGSNGVGKTMMSCIIMREVYKHRYTARRVTFSEYISKYTFIWGANTPTEKESLETEFYTKYKAVDFLVLEEVGKEVDNKIATPILEDLLRYREDKGLVTCICANLNPETIHERYGESIFSLIQGNMLPIIIETTDKRKERLQR